MAGQAGWYNAPGEAGQLRYWNGDAWTDHRQPVPAEVVPVPSAVAPAPAPIPEPVVSAADSAWDAPHAAASVSSIWDQPSGHFEPTTPTEPAEPDWSMDQFEKQFETSHESALHFDPLSDLDPDGRSGALAAAPAPFAMPPVAVPAPPASLLTAPAPVLPQPVAAPAAAPAAAPSSAFAMPATGNATFDRFAHAAETFAESSSGQGLAEELGGAALAADGVVGFGRSRKSILAALKGMGAGLVFIAIGLGLMFYSAQQDTPAAGQVKTVGIITSLHSSGGACDPIARFAGRGGSYEANSGISISPCPFQLGQSVDVVYAVADPAGSGKIAVPNAISQYFIAIPILGAVVFISSLITFIVRAGSIAGGIALIRNGEQRRRRGSPQPESAGPAA